MRLVSLLVFGAGLLWSAPAAAAVPIEDGSGFLSFLAIFALGCLVAGILHHAGRRFGYAPAVLFVAIGFVVGPFAGIVPPDLTSQSWPLIACILAHYGLIFGLHFDVVNFRSTDFQALRVAGGLAALGFAIPLLLFWTQMDSIEPGSARVMWLAVAIATGAVWTAVELRPTRVHLDHYQVWGRFRLFGMRVGQTAGALAIGGFGLAMVMMREATVVDVQPTDVLKTAGLQILVGAALGVIGRLVSGGSGESSSRILAMIGIVLASAGWSLYMDLSAMWTGLIAGIVWAQLDRHSTHLSRRLLGLEPVLAAIVFTWAGMWWSGEPAPWILLVVVAYLLVRRLVQRGALLVSRVPSGRQISAMIWPAGALSAGMLVELKATERHPVEAEWFMGLLLAIVVAELLSRGVLRRTVLDAGTTEKQP